MFKPDLILLLIAGAAMALVVCLGWFLVRKKSALTMGQKLALVTVSPEKRPNDRLLIDRRGGRLMPAPELVAPEMRPCLSRLEARYREARVSYDQFHADHITEILAENRQTLAQLNAARVDLDRQLDEIAQYHISSNEEAAAILALVFEVTPSLEDASNYHGLANILRYLRHDPPYGS